MSNRRGEVFVHNVQAGYIEQQADGEFVFQYHPSYLSRAESTPASLTLPLRQEPYQSKTLFPFFDGLIPEGWLLDIAVESWKLNPRDRMGLLLATCRDCIGAVHIEEVASR